jgi:hypothetical protein
MKKIAILAATFSALVVSSGGAYSGSSSSSYPFGDEPYTLDFGYFPYWNNWPQIQSGCWQWNWQQSQWNDRCPVYVAPKAYMHPWSSRAALRTKG